MRHIQDTHTHTQRYRLRGFATCLALLLVAAAVSAAQTASALRKDEFKLTVTALDAATALRMLGLELSYAEQEIVYYFDTRDRVLQAHHLTLRARQPGGHSADSTVKLRASAGTLELNTEERALPVEQDWTNERGPSAARSINHKKIENSVFDKVVTGLLPVKELFTDSQRHLVVARVPGVTWESLEPIGPVQADVWSRQAQLAGFAHPVTVELWNLRQGEREQQILEVSAKVRVNTESEAQQLAKQFFAATRSAGLGEPNGLSKTTQVMDFFTSER